MIHLGNPAGDVTSRGAEHVGLRATDKSETVKALAEGANSLGDIAERASHALLKVSAALTHGVDALTSYKLHHETLERLWNDYRRADFHPGGREPVASQIAQERETFAHARANATAQGFVALDRALTEVLDVVNTGPGAEDRVYRINEIRRSLTEHAKAAAKDFSEVISGIASERDTGYELGGRLRRIEEERWASPVWGVLSQVGSEIRQTIEERTRDIVQAAFPGVQSGSGRALIELLKASPAYSDNQFSAFIHKFVGAEDTLRGFDTEPLKALNALQSWSIKTTGMAAVETAEVSPLLKSLGAGVEAGRHLYVSACEALAHFGWQTNSAFDRSLGEKTGGDIFIDKVLSAREECVRDLVREVNAQLSTSDRDGPRWEDPYQPLAALKSFGCQGLTAAIDIARQNPWRADYVSEVLEALRTVSDPRPGGNFKYLDALGSTRAAPLADQVRSEGVALCMAHIDSKELRHGALWTLIHLAPEDEAVREKVRGMLTSDDGCRQVQLVEGYKSHLGLSDKEIESAWERYRTLTVPRY